MAKIILELEKGLDRKKLLGFLKEIQKKGLPFYKSLILEDHKKEYPLLGFEYMDKEKNEN
jgi:hypothetical protein